MSLITRVCLTDKRDCVQMRANVYNPMRTSARNQTLIVTVFQLIKLKDCYIIPSLR